MLIEMKNINKSYGNVKANKNVSLNLKKGEILALIGENGAGKSTIMKILYGLEKADSGEILVNGNIVNFKNPKDAIKHSIGMVQQHFMLFDDLSVYENIIYNQEVNKLGFLDVKANLDVVNQLQEKYGLKVNPKAKISDISVGMGQRVEILKILYQNADIIIFDEPSAVLTPIEVDELIKTMKNLKALGKSIIIITHKLREVMDACDRVFVMRDGEVVHETLVADTDVDKLSYQMIGRELTLNEHPIAKPTAKILAVDNVSAIDDHGKLVLNNVSLEVYGGEIVGICGVSGNGQSELIRCISGIDTNYQGNITLVNQNISNKPVNVVRKAGLSHIPEDRYFWGSAKDATLKENLMMGLEHDKHFVKCGIINHKNVNEHATKTIKKYGVKADNYQQKIKELSGGNAQKLIVAREIEQNKPFLIACEPTRGVDIGAMEFVHQKLIEKRNNNDAILLVSSELSEIISLSDRIYVMFEGEIKHEFKREEFDERKLGLIMTGGNI